MKFKIATFAQIRHFKPNQIPISTCFSAPKWYRSNNYQKEVYFLDKNNVINGICEHAFSPQLNLSEDEMCRKECPYRGNPNGCAFLREYEKAINKIDFNWLMNEFNRIAEDVKKINCYEGEPEIVLIVYEALGNPCSERYAIKRYLESHQVKIEDFGITS